MEAEWVTGDCWLGCGRTGLPVVWLGPVQWEGQHAPFLACVDCLERLKAQTIAYFMQRQPAVAGTWLHAAPAREDSGKTPRGAVSHPEGPSGRHASLHAAAAICR